MTKTPWSGLVDQEVAEIRIGRERLEIAWADRVLRIDGTWQLLRARDANKDQSYFLHMLSQEQLRRLLFPLGELSKGDVRAEAAELDLPGAHKGESQELCFVPTGRYDRFVEEQAAPRVRPGPIVDSEGAVIGQHQGVHRFTVGQRKNLGVALGHKAYVVDIDAEQGRVVLGKHDELLSDRAILGEFSLAHDLELPVRAEVSVRYRGHSHAAAVRPHAAGAEVCFDSALPAVVVGQYAVLYEGDRVLGGGLITSVSRADAPTDIEIRGPAQSREIDAPPG